MSGFGDRILLVYEPGLDFFDAFLGCLASGRVAVVVYPPMPSSGSSLRKFTAVQADCGAQAGTFCALEGLEGWQILGGTMRNYSYMEIVLQLLQRMAIRWVREFPTNWICMDL